MVKDTNPAEGESGISKPPVDVNQPFTWTLVLANNGEDEADIPVGATLLESDLPAGTPFDHRRQAGAVWRPGQRTGFLRHRRQCAHLP